MSEEYWHNLTPGLKAYYDNIAKIYDELKTEIVSLKGVARKSISPHVERKERIEIKKHLNKLTRQFDLLNHKVDRLLSEKYDSEEAIRIDEFILKEPINSFYHSVRLGKILEASEYTTYQSLLDAGSFKLKLIPLMGTKSLNELRKFFYDRGHFLT